MTTGLASSQRDEPSAQESRVEDLYPLTPLQQGMLFESLRAPSSGVYVEQFSCLLRGELDLRAFAQSWQQLVDRHPIHRTAFAWEGLDEPLQVVYDWAELPVMRLDWRHLSTDGLDRRWQDWLAEDRRRGFDLGEAPLMRLALIQTGEDAYRFVWSFHHILLDGWCTPLILHDVFGAYAALRGHRAYRAPYRRPYRDYIAWLQAQDGDTAEAYWRKALAGFDKPTPLPANQTGEGTVDFAACRQLTRLLSAERTASLQSFAQSHRLTLNTLIQAAWALLLGRHSQSEDVLFGVTVAGRPADLPGAESMVGLFINTLPLRVQLPAEAKVVDWLAGLLAQNIEMRQHEHASLTQIQGWAGIVRGQPLFDSLLGFENYPMDAALTGQEAGLEIAGMRMEEQTNYPLLLLAIPSVELELRIDYDSRRFNEAAIRRMVGHLEHLLETMLAKPEARLGEIALLTAEERRQILAGWNATTADYPRSQTLPALFEAQAKAMPDAVAVSFGGQSLSYANLDRRANQIAHCLRSRGIGQESLVGLCLERSLDMLAGLLGILKAGGAYVSLDSSLPSERLAYILKETRATLILARQGLLSDWMGQGVDTLCLDLDAAEIAASSEESPASHGLPDQLAYVAYTSGSTGTPKGVAVTHRAVARLVKGQAFMTLGPDEAMLHFAPLAFDASTLEIWGALLNGGRLAVAPPGPLSLEELGRTIREEQVTTAWLTAGLFQQMVEHRLEDLAGLRQLLAGGDIVPVAHARKLRHTLPQCRLVNGYGPTENTTFSACHPVSALAATATAIPIGRPIANSTAYVLDKNLELLPIGVPGELYVGGDGLARGYLHRPELTAERFIPDPFGASGGRLYKTGDKVRWDEDGNLEFLGRLDRQVKIRGYRIEPDEVEARLAEHPGLRQAVVAVREDVPGDKRLVAYVVAEDGLSEHALHTYLAQRLPSYMLPSAWMFLDALPLTSTGKPDRNRLPAPGSLAQAEGLASPRNLTEELLAPLWAELLHLERVGVHEDFFALGGHSLLATQLVSRIRELFQVELPLRDLFDAPSIAQLAERIEAAQRGAQGLTAPAIVPIPRNGPLPLSHAQQRLWFMDQLEPNNPFYNVPLAVGLDGPLQMDALEQALNEMIRRHETLRARFAAVDGLPVQTVIPELRLALPLTDLSVLPSETAEAEARRLAEEEARRPFDLATGPLIRAALIRLAEQEHIALLTLHHIVADGWSLGVLVKEMAALYQAFRAGQPSPLPALAIQYADFAHWQQSWLRGDVLDAQLAYWQRQLAGAPPMLELPWDRPRRTQQAYRGGTVEFSLGPELADALRELSRREGVTLFMTLLSAYQLLLSRHSGQLDVCVGTPVANRTRLETEGLIGFFVNTLVLRADLSGNPPFTGLLRRVRDAALGAQAHQDLPFEKLVEALQPERNLGHSPLFQAMFALLDMPLEAVEIPGLRLRPLPACNETAKFDLSLDILEEGQDLRGLLEYDADLFDVDTIRRMAVHFVTLLEGIAARPDAPISAVPLLSAEESQGLLVDWNETYAPYPLEKSFQECFEAQVGRTPDAIAVACDGISLDYQTLNRRANRIAHALIAQGVGPDDVVALLDLRGIDLLLMILAVFKAGGAYLPLDPGQPVPRLARILGEARPRLLLAGSRLIEKAGQAADMLDAKPVLLDLTTAQSTEESNPPVRSAAGHLAYVIYTSGSTGVPKGAMIEQRGMMNNLWSKVDTLGLGPRDAIAQTASQCFDISVWQFLTALVCGGRTHILTDETAQQPSALLAAIVEQGITVLESVPAMMQAMLEEDRQPSLSGLRWLLPTGEALPPQTCRDWMARHPGMNLLNAYGPAECSDDVSYHAIATPPPAELAHMPIGRPIANLRLYVLDARLSPVPVGVVGELCVAGVGVGRGYLNDAGRTAQAFLPDPISLVPGSRMYKTGDLVRHRPDGTLEFLGRTDHQVKLRGFRIELGEIEAHLLRHPKVKAAVVALREDSPGDKRLVAYVESHADTEADAEVLRGHLVEVLPGYMIPANIVVLRQLPLTSNGKLDRKNLPVPEIGLTIVRQYIPPRTEAEQKLASLWAEVLGLEQVGLQDDFFALGGHSLLAVRVVAKARQAFGTELPLRSLFEHPTLAEFAGLLPLEPNWGYSNGRADKARPG